MDVNIKRHQNYIGVFFTDRAERNKAPSYMDFHLSRYSDR